MTEEKKRMLRKIYGIALGVYSVIVGVLFIVQVWALYWADPNGNPYTVDSISAHYSQIAVFIWLWIAALLGGIILGYLFPQEELRVTGGLDEKKMLARLKMRLPKEQTDMQELKGYAFQRKVFRWVSVVLCILAAAMCLKLLFDQTYTAGSDSEFFNAHNAVVDRMIRCVPWLVGAFAVCIAYAVFEKRSVKKETVYIKALLAENAKQGIKPDVAKKNEKENQPFTEKLCKKFPFLRSKGWALGVRIGVCVIGVIFVVIGMLNGGMRDVLMKAVNICTQCIGLG